MTMPPGWAQATIGELGIWSGGSTPAKTNPDFWQGGTIPWVSPKDMKAMVLTAVSDSVTEIALERTNLRLLPADTVALVVRSGILERMLPVARIPFPATVNQDLKAVSPGKGIDPRWVLYAIRALEGEILRNCRKSGTTVANLDSARLLATPLAVPPTLEQARIVAAIEEAFSLLDAGETSLHDTRTRLRRMRESVLTAAVTGQLVPQDPSDNPAIPGSNPSDTSVTPGGWRWARVSDLLAQPLANGRSVSTREGGFPVLRLTSIRNGAVDLTERKPGDWTAREAEPFLVKRGDFLVSRGNGSLGLVGRGGLVRVEPDDVAFPDTLIRVRLRPDTLISELLPIWWSTSHVRKQIESKARTTAGIYKINQTMIENLLLPVPPTPEQVRIVTEVERQFSFIGAAERAVDDNLKRSTTLRRSVLQAAFEGRLVPQDASDEPASVLLERIREGRVAPLRAQAPAARRRAK